MNQHLCITVRFLQPCSHGRGDRSDLEWPLSALRLYQAFVAAAAGRWNERSNLNQCVDALRWLAQRGVPTLDAPVGVPANVAYRLYVPDNIGDGVPKSWSAGRDGTIADYRTEKDVRPTLSCLGVQVKSCSPVLCEFSDGSERISGDHLRNRA